jgi:hypothetical protein
MNCEILVDKGVGLIMKGQGNVRRLLNHEEVNFQSVLNQAAQLKWRWKHCSLVVGVV